MNLCRVCQEGTELVIDFGLMPRANAFESEPGSDSHRFRLATFFCSNCFLFQLTESPEPGELFTAEYPFFTSMSKSMIEHFRQFAISEVIETASSSTKVIEIGSNDGTFLKVLHEAGITYLGIDPSESAIKKAKSSGLNCFHGFFGLENINFLQDSFGMADYVIGANVVCHIPDLLDFFEAVSRILKEDGTLIFEEPYLGDMLKLGSYDQIYDEHVFIFSILAINKILERTDLELIDIKHQETHGGSMRYIIKRRGVAGKSTQLQEMLKAELELGLDKMETFRKFAETCMGKREAFSNLLHFLKSEKKIVVGYGATSKSTTILNFCNVDNSLIRVIGDSTPEKVGKFTPGTRIPIVTHEEVRSLNPDYVVMFAWNHFNEIMTKDKFIRDSSAKIISIVPNVSIIDKSDV